MMSFYVGNIVDDDITVVRIFFSGLQSAVCGLRSAVCGLQSANVIHRSILPLGTRLHGRRYMSSHY